MNVELSHVGELCGFDAFLAKYRLDDAALKQLAASEAAAWPPAMA